MTSDEIRQTFLEFFRDKGHKVLPSSSLIPHKDPTLLLTSAGMVQIKPYFLGLEVPPSPRLASCQKCFRTTDIDSVGDSKHLTFFEMLGNFSVGDYFKKEAISWAWEFVTEYLKLPRERLWVTVYLDDDEAFTYWQQIGVPSGRILRFGEEDNFWGPAGDSGPCGPCSEIHYDLGEEFGCGRPECKPNCQCGRFSEIWNLVFTQYNQDSSGQRTLLPRPNIDTGMGLERTAAAIQGKSSVYEIDLFAPLIEKVSRLAGKNYGEDENIDRAIRIVAEHSRGAVFLIADGVSPSNEGTGYVLRRILRRASLFGRKLGKKRFLEDIAQEVIQNMQHSYPELKRNYVHILSVIDEEEKGFHDTLDFSLNLWDGISESMKDKGEKRVSGEVAFHLYDTYGLPKEVLAEVAEQSGFEIEWEGFEKELEQQRDRARAAHKSKLGEIMEAPAYTGGNLPEIKFEGRKLKHRTVVLQLAIKGAWKRELFEGYEGEVVLRETPFYGEMGGQVGDTGEILGKKGRFIVEDTIRPWPELTIHRGKVVEGYISLNDTVIAQVDDKRRLDIARNHTATHLLQAALRQVLGSRVYQRGSLVEPERFRFDFSHLAPITEEQLTEVQRQVNEWVRQNLKVKPKDDVPYDQAIAEGAIALFGEKYGETVRMLEIGEPAISKELCGGTHVKSTGEIGLFVITSESSIGTGLRRIEAVTGRAVESLVERHLSALQAMAKELESPLEEVQDKVRYLVSELETERKRTLSLERELSRKVAESLLEQAEQVNGVTVLAAKVPPLSMPILREMGDILRDRLKSAVVVLATIYNDKPNFLAMVAPDLVARGFHAGNLIKQVAAITGGGGGGKATMAQAGGKDAAKIDEALKLVHKLVRKEMSF